MKKVITLLTVFSILAFVSTTKAQLVINYISNHVVGADNTAALDADAKIINNSGSSVTVKVLRSNVSLAPGHNSYFCVNVNCYTPATFVSPPETILPGDSILLIAYATAGGVNGTDVVNYKVYDINDSANNKVSVDFTYDFATGIKAVNPASLGYMNCSQSNTEEITNISYSIANFKDGRLVIRNLLGSVIKEIRLADKQGLLRVPTAELPAGIYMYFLVNNDEPVATKKMVISHK